MSQQCLLLLKLQSRADGIDHDPGHSGARPHRLPHGAGVARQDHQRTGDGQVQGWLQPLLQGLLAQLLLRPVRATVSQVSEWIEGNTQWVSENDWELEIGNRNGSKNEVG